MLEHHPIHRKCKRLLQADVGKFTCKTVERELKRIQQRRRDYNKLLVAYKYKPETDYTTYVKGLAIPPTDKQFLLRIRQYLLNNYRGKDWFGMYRIHQEIITKEIARCLETEIENPLVKRANDALLFSAINTIVTNKVDCQILADMIVGLRNTISELNFTTEDKQDFLNNKTAITQLYENHFKTVCFFRILKVQEALHLLP